MFSPFVVKQSRTHILHWPEKKNENFGSNGDKFKNNLRQFFKLFGMTSMGPLYEVQKAADRIQICKIIWPIRKGSFLK
jgi:hypothetical protein